MCYLTVAANAEVVDACLISRPQSLGRAKLTRPSGVNAVMQNGNPVQVAKDQEHVEGPSWCWAAG
jgi:hypothetical protein